MNIVRLPLKNKKIRKLKIYDFNCSALKVISMWSHRNVSEYGYQHAQLMTMRGYGRWERTVDNTKLGYNRLTLYGTCYEVLFRSSAPPCNNRVTLALPGTAITGGSNTRLCCSESLGNALIMSTQRSTTRNNRTIGCISSLYLYKTEDVYLKNAML